MATPSVLVIDDEDYVTDMLASALRLEGYTVHVAYNGREGLACLQTLPIDLTIIDIMMPYLSGVELVQRVRALEQRQNLPIVLISAGARPKQQFDGVVFVPKPFDLDALLDLVATLLRERHEERGRG